MLLALDVHYDLNRATAAAVVFADRTDATPTAVYLNRLDQVPDYEPGAFYKRELPCLLALLDEHRLRPTHTVIDGYVDLDNAGRPGLGRHLYAALGGDTVVIGVAKTAFSGIDDACALRRGVSARPLYVTSAGVDAQWARARIHSMHSAHRIPTLLKTVDRLCRTGLP
jgi:deoxyribonuclease V